MSTPGNSLNSLPPELLCHIFRLTIDELYATRKDRCRLMLVCRQWREYVEGSAVLWTDISARDSLNYVHRALARSKGAMLDIRCWMIGMSHVQLKPFMVKVSPYITRWRSVSIAFILVPSLEGPLGPLTTTQVPSLEILTVSVTRTRHRDAITLFGGAPAPATLRELTLENIPVAIEPLSLSGLVSLDLTKVPTISTPQLLEILRRSPWLETLCLDNISALVALGSQASNIQPIELPKLDSLSLRWIDHGGTNSILSNIRIPNRRRVYIRGDVGAVGATAVLFTSTITHLLHTITPTVDVSSSTIRVVQYGDFDFTITFRGVELELFVDGENSFQEILGWLARGLGSEAANCPVHLIIDWSETDSLPVTTVPPPLVVKHLSILNSMLETSREDLYIAMAQPLDPASSSWLYPQMESLSVEFETVKSQEQLVSMLRSRYDGATSLGETELRRPASLGSVELRGYWRMEGLVEEIKGILGEAEVFWADE